MALSELNAISPIDGRYRKQCEALSPILSEFGLIKYRLMVEVEYLLFLSEIPLPQLGIWSDSAKESLRNLYNNFTEHDASEIKEIEKTTNHDVKAVEYFLKGKLEKLGLGQFSEFVHFGLTSQDINNTAIPFSLKTAYNEIVLPWLEQILSNLEALAAAWAEVPMLAKTHGQAASPTKLGKEFMVFVERLKNQIISLRQIPFTAKFGGATGNFNAHQVAYPQIDWVQQANIFVNERLNLQRVQYSTQIEHYDNMAALFQANQRINTILIDLCRDVWSYVSMDYFKQKLKAGEVGSSAMPHKVNPIDFENAEGNLGMANAIFAHLAEKLPISRLQRDLTDSTVLRNIGVPLGHSILAYQSILKGLNKLILNEEALYADLEKNYAVVAEAIQTILRREGYPKPYEALKELTRTNQSITQESIALFIDGLAISESLKSELKNITPHNYTGVF
jgi:adenylosuccinate lyase